MEEFFDAWKAPKCIHDYHMFFNDWWEKDLEATVNRDYNHPSVIMWSIGNEITEVDGTSGGFRIAAMLSKKTRELDPSRPVTSALILLPDLTGAETAQEIEAALAAFYPAIPDSEGSEKPDTAAGKETVDNVAKNTFAPVFSEERDYWGDTTRPFADTLDIVGYNYMSERYEFDTHKFRDRLIVGSETFPGRIAEYWALVKKYRNVIGDFCWTAQDYLGEAGIGLNYIGKPWKAKGDFPCRISGSGDLDLTGERRPLSYFREIVWERTQTPYIVTKSPALNGKYIGTGMWGWDEVQPCWTYPGYEGQMTEVTVYSNAEKAALYVNGRFAAVRSVTDYRASFKIPYEPGVLEAVSLKNQIETGRQKLVTAGSFAKYRVELVWKDPEMKQEYYRITAEDADGIRLFSCNDLIKASVHHAEIAAFGSAAPFTQNSYVTDTTRLYRGSVLLVVQKTKEPYEKTIVSVQKI